MCPVKNSRNRAPDVFIWLQLSQKPESQVSCALLLVLANKIISMMYCITCSVLISSYHCYYDVFMHPAISWCIYGLHSGC